MSLGDSKLQSGGNHQQQAQKEELGRKRCNRALLRRGLVALLAAGSATLLQVLPAFAQGQFIPCAPLNQPLVGIPELILESGKPSQAIILTDVTQRTNLNPNPANTENCVAQFVRNFVGVDATAAAYGVSPRSGFTPPTRPNEFYADPVPGPTLRARVGDLIQLTFLNQVDPAHFGDTIDTGDTIGACDESSSGRRKLGYPQIAHEHFPNCFHGSSSANIHFHGTHTNPNSTGDNVFLNVAPSPRDRPLNGNPTVTAKVAQDWFTPFFQDCEKKLKDDVLSEWPHTWADLPESYRKDQETLLNAYDMNRPQDQKVWPVDQDQIAKGRWPQYFIGAYPYCFRLPEYQAGGWPPAAPTVHSRTLRADVPKVLQMGQSPGTHWYHAHKHGSTAINVLNGMTGAFIIEGGYDDDLNRNYGTTTPPSASAPVLWTRAQPVLVINELGVSPPLLGGGIGGGLPFSVNGRLQPVLTMRPNEVQLWRIVNTSSRGFANIIGPPLGFAWRQLAQDGVQFSQDNYTGSENAPSFLLAPGNRVDLLVKAPGTVTTTPIPVMVQQVVSRLDLPNTTPTSLMSVQIAGDTPSNPRQTQFIAKAPTPPTFLADITDKEIKSTKIITFNSKASLAEAQHTVDGKQFDGKIGKVVLVNEAEEWTIVNTTVADGKLGPATPIDHPFHIHLNPFQITEVFDPNAPLTDEKTGRPVMESDSGKPYPKYVFQDAAKKRERQCVINPQDKSTWKPCSGGSQRKNIWWDVFPIPAAKIATDSNNNPIIGTDGQPVIIGGYFKMRSRFVDYPGFYVLHCHILAHEDRGMMTVVYVQPLSAPFQHH